MKKNECVWHFRDQNQSKGSDTPESFLSKVAFESDFRKKSCLARVSRKLSQFFFFRNTFSRLEHVLFLHVSLALASQCEWIPLTTFRISRQWRIRKSIPMYPDRLQNLITCSLVANVAWKFHTNPFGSFCAKLLNRQRQLHILLGGGDEDFDICVPT